MIGLDTNILVRYVVQDDPAQARRATEIIEQRISQQNPGFVNIVAMVETAWVLKRTYRFSDALVAEAIERMLRIGTLIVESEQEVFTAMVALKEGHGSFGDALIGELGRRAGCLCTLTFDREAALLPGFVAA